MNLFVFLLLITFGYIIGSLNGAHIIAKLFYGKNISLLGTKNAGAGNMFTTLGIRAGFAAGVIDFTKGVVPVLAGSFFNFSPAILLFVGASTIAGHNWPLFFHFQGGRGTATLFGVISALVPQTMAQIALVFIPLSLFPISGFFPILALTILDYFHLPNEGLLFLFGTITIVSVIMIRKFQTEWHDFKNAPDKLLAFFNMIFTDHVATEAKNRMGTMLHLFYPKIFHKKKYETSPAKDI